MDSNEQTLLVSTWIEYTKKSYGGKEPHKDCFWAFEKMEQATHSNPELAWKLILEVLRSDKSDLVVANLAAGPLEDLLVYHGRTVIDRVEKQASNDPSFKKLLGGVWPNSISSDVWEKIEKVRGAAW